MSTTGPGELVKAPKVDQLYDQGTPKMKPKPCRHETLLARIKLPVNEYVCDDCKAKLVLVIPQYGLMTPEEFEQFKRAQALQITAAKRRQSTGLVTPAEHRQEQAQVRQQKEGKR